MICIATFFSHYGAVACKKACEKAGLPAKLMPVPRRLSSSCGTCVRIETQDPDRIPRSGESEKIALETPEGYRILWQAEDT